MPLVEAVAFSESVYLLTLPSHPPFRTLPAICSIPNIAPYSSIECHSRFPYSEPIVNGLSHREEAVMNSVHKSMHDQRTEQGGHHGHGHSHIAPSAYDGDEGVKLMRRFGMLQAHGLFGPWMSNYRNTRIIPVSNSVFASAVGVLLIGLALWYFLPANLKVIGLVTAGAAAIYLIAITLFGIGLMLFMRGVRKSVRQTIINSVPMKGDEQVLDVACGAGMLLNGFAQRLTTGKAFGIDIFQPNSGGGSLAQLHENAKAEGVENKISFQNMDARHLQFEDARFGVVASSLALHHIGTTRQEIEQAVIEMVRVLKAGGYIALVDLAPMIDIAEGALQREGLKFTQQTSNRYFKFVTAQKL
jgi:ubiquinone/menaquinone biosynthesis C-methylase UbiE